MTGQNDHYDVSSFDPEIDEEIQDYDGDDVSYRLRLLVKNNYFLPPAHSKPSPSDLAPLVMPKRPARATTPTFLDIFRVGKSKSKPSTPTTGLGFDPMAPILRATSDSITTPGHAAHPQPRLSCQAPRLPPQPGSSSRDRSGRVVVVREKMNDLVLAAKQAEQDMKARNLRREQGSQKGQPDIFNDVIDPTDAVDLPHPSSTYPFVAQASALHGLGVQDSVGAALLAERLPPPRSPGMSSSFDTEDEWRKALLQEAVHHSLDHSPDASSFSMMFGAASTPLASPRVSQAVTTSRGPSPGTKRLLEQRIVEKPLLETPEATPPLSRKKSNHSQASASKDHSGANLAASPTSFISHESSRPSSFLPLRVETPSGPLTPLTPPPRRHLINPLYSLSQTDLPSGNQTPQPLIAPRTPTLRKTMSSPMLSDSYESSHRQGMMMTPPPVPNLAIYSRTSSREHSSVSFDTSREQPVAASVMTTSESSYSDDGLGDGEGTMPRTSMALSALNGRPSLSEYSQPSPTTSAFQDELTRGGYHSTSSSFHRLSRISVDPRASTSRDSPAPRYSTMSPPPRMSSSLAHIALSPPPRSSSFHYTTVPSHLSISTPGSDPGHYPTPGSSDPTVQILAPEPVTPPLPVSKRRGDSAAIPLSLDIPPTKTPLSIRSAPGPSSPTSFFDSIQTQPNAMDDLESSSDESEDENEGEDPNDRGPTNLFVDPRTRTISHVSAADPRSFTMRMGNHSAPYVARPMQERRPTLPLGLKDMKPPVGHIPPRAPFFTERKSDLGDGLPTSTYDFYKYAQQRPPTAGETSAMASTATPKRRPATADPGSHVKKWQTNQRAQESLRRLDGMLIQHMEAEKDTLKRIATTLHSNSKS